MERVFAFVDQLHGFLSRFVSWFLVALVFTLSYEVAVRYLFRSLEAPPSGATI